MPSGEQRHKMVIGWATAQAPWIGVSRQTKEEYLVGRWEAAFGDKSKTAEGQ